MSRVIERLKDAAAIGACACAAGLVLNVVITPWAAPYELGMVALLLLFYCFAR